MLFRSRAGFDISSKNVFPSHDNVPLDLIWKSFDASVIQMGEVAPVQSKDILTALTVSGDLPYCSLSD